MGGERNLHSNSNQWCTLIEESNSGIQHLRQNRVDTVATRKALQTKIAKFANSRDPDEAAHNEPSQLGLHCLPTSL